MTLSKRSKEITVKIAGNALHASGKIEPHDMSRLKRMAYLYKHGAREQAQAILDMIEAGPAKDAGLILKRVRGASQDPSLRELAARMRASVTPTKGKKKTVA